MSDVNARSSRLKRNAGDSNVISLTPTYTAARPIWQEPVALPDDVRLEEIHPDPLLAALLYRRGIRDAAAAADFLSIRPRVSPDPFGVPNMEAATARVGAAIERGERVGIFGDYDADGITSAALLVVALRAALGVDRVAVTLPERSEGYGLNQRGIDELHAGGATLLIAVDCGSSDHEAVTSARALGMDVVVLDHHRMRDDGPEGAITVSPQLRADGHCHELTAVGVAFLLISALAREGHPVAVDDERSLLDLVALGTVADVASLVGCNRPLVRDGLVALQRTTRPGLRALFERAGLEAARITTEDIGFRLAPRLNAAGRMASPKLALDLLLTPDAPTAATLADEIERLNGQRKTLAERMTRETLTNVAKLPDWERRPVLVLELERRDGEPGVLGAVASRLVEQLSRPVLMVQGDGECVHGSARSVPGLDMAAAFADLDSLLIRHGGHSLAAGLSLARHNLPALEAGLVEIIDRLGLDLPAPKTITIDADLPPDRLTLATADALRALEPCGTGNETPVFRVRGAEVLRYTAMGADRRHLRITFRTKGTQAEAICWGAAHRSRELLHSRTIDLAGKLGVNRWNGNERIQFIAEDFRPAEG